MTQNPELSVVRGIEAMPELPEANLYAHELLANGGEIWLACADRNVIEKAHDPGETGEEIRALYTADQMHAYALTYASQTLASRDGEIARLRGALNALVDRKFTFFSGTMVGADKAIRQKEVQAARAALAPQPTKEQ